MAKQKDKTKAKRKVKELTYSAIDETQVKAQRSKQVADPATLWRSRIVGHDRVDPASLLAHPDNWRVHLQIQQAALKGAIDEIGYLRSVTVNIKTGRIIDGHLRVSLALRDNQPLIDVEYVDLTEAEELKALATLDPIGALAATDEAKINDVYSQIKIESAALDQVVAGLSRNTALLSPSLDFAEGAQFTQGFIVKIDLPVGKENDKRFKDRLAQFCKREKLDYKIGR